MNAAEWKVGEKSEFKRNVMRILCSSDDEIASERLNVNFEKTTIYRSIRLKRTRMRNGNQSSIAVIELPKNKSNTFGRIFVRRVEREEAETEQQARKIGNSEFKTASMKNGVDAEGK